jgi:hypothetical protein
MELGRKMNRSYGWTALHISSLAAVVDLDPDSNVISLVDLERPTPVLENVDDADLEAIKKLTHTSTIWLTNGNIMDAADPATALIIGLTRSVVTEEPNLRFRLLDFDVHDLANQTAQCIELICEQAAEFFFSPQSSTTAELDDIRPEREFAVKDNTVFISRYVPDMSENQRWNTEHNSHGYKPDLVQQEIGDIAVKMKLQEIGQLDSLCFYTEDTEVPPGPDEVEFRVTASTINPKGVVILMGIFEPDQPANDKPYHSSFEHTGTVLRVGENVVDIRPGDTVVSCWSGDYGTVERAPAFACQKIPAEDAMVHMHARACFCYIILKAVLGSSDDAGGLHDSTICFLSLGTITRERGTTLFPTIHIPCDSVNLKPDRINPLSCRACRLCCYPNSFANRS